MYIYDTLKENYIVPRRLSEAKSKGKHSVLPILCFLINVMGHNEYTLK